MTIYFDETDHNMDGHGWNVVDPDDIGGIAARFRTQREAEAWKTATSNHHEPPTRTGGTQP